jgi:hypothetical protein
VACNAGGAPPAGSATLYIGLDYGAARGSGWESDYPVQRRPLTNVLDGDVPSDQMPCGAGGYSRFQAGGQPFIAWAGFGSGVTDADRQAIVDIFNGMQVSDAELSAPSSDVPGYVIAGGTVGSGDTAWTIEVSPTDTNVDMHYSEAGSGRAGGVADFTVPVVPIEVGAEGGIVFGAVTFEADRVEVRPADGSEPVPGSILRLPESLNAPFNAFVVPNGGAGKIVAGGPQGDLGSAPFGARSPEPPTATPPAFPPTSAPKNGISLGQSAGVNWSIVVDGSRLVLQDGAGAELASVSLADDAPMTLGTYEFGSGDAAERVAFGVIRDPAVDVQPMIDQPKWHTSVLHNLPDFHIPGQGVVYITTFLGPYDGVILGMAGPCDAVAAFQVRGDASTPTNVPTLDCVPPATP